jgi:hypothetical protein
VRHIEGDAWADDVIIEDVLPSVLSIVGAETSWGSVSTSGNTVRVEIDQLFPGDTITITIYAAVTGEITDSSITNTATVSSSTDELDSSNNTSTITLPECQIDPTATPDVGATETALVAPTVAGTAVVGTPVVASPTAVPPLILPETGAIPATLPETSGSTTQGMPLLALTLGLGAIMLGIFIVLIRNDQE